MHVLPDPPGREDLRRRRNRSLKQRLVEEGRAHAALVFDGVEAVAWAQYGTRRVFEEAGFTYVRPKGLRNCVLRARV